MASELRQLARFLSGLRYEDLSEELVRAAKMCLLDTVASAIGGVHNAQVQNVTAEYVKFAGENGRIKLWGREQYAPLLTAVFLNGLMGHTLEMDDVHTASKSHIGVVVIPAAWGLAQQLDRNGKELLLAVVCGYEAMSRIGMALGVSSHRNRGWHVTGTAGTFGAAAACAKLLGLDEEQTLSAFGMAGTQSSGLWAFLADGASCKVLHTGRAAASGCEAALLAKAGMTGPEHILTAADGGMLAAMSEEYDVGKVCYGLGESWEILQLDNKPYPCCRSTHCAIDAALELRARGVMPEEVSHIEVDTYLVGNKQCGMSEGSRKPKNPVDAKFSTPFTVACALLFGRVTLKEFLPETIVDARVQELLSRVSVRTDEQLTDDYPAHWGCRMTATLKDGRQETCFVKDASGSVNNPLSEEQLKAKAIALLAEAYGDCASALAETLLSAEEWDRVLAI
ncbi:MAG: MmgE/PrpD family protein [Oscillospiraceae bacterium]|nr:MmgE/PrpD family protein [Oscillospiraceae bacterium]